MPFFDIFASPRDHHCACAESGVIFYFFQELSKIRVSNVDQKKVFLARHFSVVFSMVLTMVTYQNVCARSHDRVETLIGTRCVEAQTNVENLSVSTFQIVAFEEDG